MSDETPYRQNPRSRKVHIRSCNVGYAASEPMSLEDVTEWVRRHGLFSSDRFTIGSAMCCGASPEAWLRNQHRDIYDRLRESNRD